LPLHYAACGVAKVEHTRMSESEQAAVCGGNALRLLGM